MCAAGRSGLQISQKLSGTHELLCTRPVEMKCGMGFLQETSFANFLSTLILGGSIVHPVYSANTMCDVFKIHLYFCLTATLNV